MTTPKPLFIADTLPTTSEAAIREFQNRYIDVVSAAMPPTWATDIGELIPVSSPYVTFPIAALQTLYQKSEGENRFKTLKEAKIDVKAEEFDDGYEARLMDLFMHVFAYQNWQKAPGRFLLAEQRLVNKSIVSLLESGTAIDCYDGAAFFDAAHPAHFGAPGVKTWSNYQSVAADVTDLTKLTAEVTEMRGVKDENGDPLGVEPDTIIVPTAKFQALSNKLAQNLILEGSATAPTSNPYLGKFKVVHAPELTDANDWYLVDSKLIAQGYSPWAALRFMAPESLGLRVYDESSDFFKDTGRIKISSHIWFGFSLLFPHAIRKVVGA